MVVFGPAHLHHPAREIDMARQRMAADLGAVARGALHVDAAAELQGGQGGQAQALLHDVEAGGLAALQRRHREAHAIDRDAGADGQARAETGRETQREAAQAGLVGQCLDAGDALNDAGEHGRKLNSRGRKRARNGSGSGFRERFTRKALAPVRGGSRLLGT